VIAVADRLTLHRSGSGPAVLLLHPLGVDRTVWRPVVERLGGFTTLTCDLPGHGRTAVSAGPTGVGEIAAQLVSALREEAAGPVHVVGVSLGGLVAQALAAHHPEVVRRLVVVDAVAVYPPAMQTMWTDRAALVRSVGMEGVIAPTLDLWFTASTLAAGDEVVDQVSQLLRTVDPEGYAVACQLLATVDNGPLLAGIAAPTLVVCGDDDAPAFTAAAPSLAAAVQNGRLAWLTGARHAGALERPDAFADLLRSFLIEEPDEA
jgi:3-oxoadipate enol-lactonase